MKAAMVMMVVLATGSLALGTSISFDGQTSFDSDLNPNGTVTLSGFDNSLGTLTSVKVEIWHSASATVEGDNDDASETGVVEARMIRQFDVTGPDLAASGSKTISSPQVVLQADDGDGGDPLNFDSTAPDGYDFGTLSYADVLVGTYYPDTSLYAGAGTVLFTVDPTSMVNDLNWVQPPAGGWQLQVEEPDLTVKIKVTYEYTPEPATVGLLAIGLFGFVWRRK